MSNSSDTEHLANSVPLGMGSGQLSFTLGAIPPRFFVAWPVKVELETGVPESMVSQIHISKLH